MKRSILLMTIFAGVALAQTKTPDIVLYGISEVKPEMVHEWYAAQTALRDVFRNGGQEFRYVYAPVFATKYITITPIPDLSQWDEGIPVQKMMGGEAFEKWATQARKGYTSLTRVAARFTGLAIRDAPGGTLPILVLTRSIVDPDRTAEFEARLKDVVMPALRKAGVKRMTVRRVIFGGAPTEYFITRSHSRMAEADRANEVVRQLPRKPGLVLSSERTVYRLYQPASFTK
ncbi:MAG: hypothetical protein HY820_31585 [Acidobacteria bacterium]|nr:hypothetical protein [Acidobacteriota bacterium]